MDEILLGVSVFRTGIMRSPTCAKAFTEKTCFTIAVILWFAEPTVFMFISLLSLLMTVRPV